jgi:hypothetical protein
VDDEEYVKKMDEIATLYPKIGPKIAFDFEEPGNPGRNDIFKKLNLFRRFYAQTSIFIIKVSYLMLTFWITGTINS